VRLTVVSHKACWPCGLGDEYGTDGGFPGQVEALAQLFDQTVLVVTKSRAPSPGGLRRLSAPGLKVIPLPEPPGRGLIRKAALPLWAARHLGVLWRAMAWADAVHAAVPGDIGTIGMLAALLRRKPLFVRHCGTWGDRSTAANRLLAWLLPRISGGQVVVVATGGGLRPPEPRNPSIGWIFATSLTEEDLVGLTPVQPWTPGGSLRMATVGRLTATKNAAACVEALCLVRKLVPGSSLEVLGDGPSRRDLEALAYRLGLEDAVCFRGNVSHAEVLRVLQTCHVFLFPTRVAEGFPKAVLEAMACGLPVVVAPVSVLPSLVEEGAGLLLEGTDGAAVAAAVERLVADPGIMASMGARGRQIAETMTLERWRDEIGARLTAAWGPLRRGGPAPGGPGGSAA